MISILNQIYKMMTANTAIINTNITDEIPKPVLKRGTHICEQPLLLYSMKCLNLLVGIDQDHEDNQEDNQDEEDQEEDQEEEAAKEQLKEHLLEQQQDNLVWSEFSQRWITEKDYETFEGHVEPIVKPIEQEHQQEHLYYKLFSRFRNNSNQMNDIFQRINKDKEYNRETNTFTDFSDLVDCFEAKKDEEDEDDQTDDEVQTEPICHILQSEIDQIQFTFENPIWEEEYALDKARIIKQHNQQCLYCPPPALPKKMSRCNSNQDEYNRIQINWFLEQEQESYPSVFIDL